ncbi:MAG TPA: hypothetical protein VGL92_03005 [Acidimicrobiia bacterium]|jgi:hypothetical protein
MEVGSSMMLARYHLSGGPWPSADEELQVDDDGSFMLYRTIGAKVGRFAGRVPAPEFEALLDEIECARPWRGDEPAGPPPYPPSSTAALSPDAAIEVFSTAAGLDIPTPGAAVDPAAARLHDRLRRWADELTDAPVGAVEASVDADWSKISIRHLGTAPVELTDLRVAAQVPRLGIAGGDEPVTSDLPAVSDQWAGSGWTWTFPLRAPAAPAPDLVLRVDISGWLKTEGVSRRVTMTCFANG